MALSPRVIAILVMVVTPLFFSSNLIFGRMVISEVSPSILAFIRWGLVALVLTPFLVREWAAVRQVVVGHPLQLLVLGTIGMLICGAGVYVALRYTTATNGNLIYTSSSVLILVIEALFLGRKISAREAIGCLLAFVGVAVIVMRGDLAALLALDFNPGDLIIVVAAIAWGAYPVIYRQPALSVLSNTALFGLIAAAGALTIAPFALGELILGAQLPVTSHAWAGIGGIVLFASLLAFSGFQFGIRTLGPSLTGIFMYLLPPYGVALAVIFLSEELHGFHAAGLALVLGGVILATFPSNRKGPR